MKTIADLRIDQEFISIFASGPSLNDFESSDFDQIRNHCFTVTMNYGPLKFNAHLNLWSDKPVTTFLKKHFEQNPSKMLLLARTNSFSRKPDPFQERIDFWFDPKQLKLGGNYTLVWAIQLFRKYFPQKPILLFGVDMSAPDDQTAKWYDSLSDFDRQHRGSNYRINQKLDSCREQLGKFGQAPDGMILNCNPQSMLDQYPKVDWREILAA